MNWARSQKDRSYGTGSITRLNEGGGLGRGGGGGGWGGGSPFAPTRVMDCGTEAQVQRAPW